MNAIYRKTTGEGENRVVREIIVEGSVGVTSGDVLAKMVSAVEGNSIVLDFGTIDFPLECSRSAD